jgi:hypothetical protein
MQERRKWCDVKNAFGMLVCSKVYGFPNLFPPTDFIDSLSTFVGMKKAWMRLQQQVF